MKKAPDELHEIRESIRTPCSEPHRPTIGAGPGDSEEFVDALAGAGTAELWADFDRLMPAKPKVPID